MRLTVDVRCPRLGFWVYGGAVRHQGGKLVADGTCRN